MKFVLPYTLRLKWEMADVLSAACYLGRLTCVLSPILYWGHLVENSHHPECTDGDIRLPGVYGNITSHLIAGTFYRERLQVATVDQCKPRSST